MNRVIVDVSPSLDGYVAGSGVSVEQPFGDAGLELYRWLGLGDGAEPTQRDRDAAEWQLGDAGAVVLGRTMFEVGIGPWGDDGAFRRPCFVVTSRPHETVIKGPTSFDFVTDGVRAAIERARAAAGERDVMVVGGADVIRQSLAAGLVDEIRLHIAPTVLGAGTSLFGSHPDTNALPRLSLELVETVATPHALHVKYRVSDRPS